MGAYSNLQELDSIQFNSKEIIDRQDWEMTLGSVGVSIRAITVSFGKYVTVTY